MNLPTDQFRIFLEIDKNKLTYKSVQIQKHIIDAGVDTDELTTDQFINVGKKDTSELTTDQFTDTYTM
jgi:hypothetical protein